VREENRRRGSSNVGRSCFHDSNSWIAARRFLVSVGVVGSMASSASGVSKKGSASASVLSAGSTDAFGRLSWASFSSRRFFFSDCPAMLIIVLVFLLSRGLTGLVKCTPSPVEMGCLLRAEDIEIRGVKRTVLSRGQARQPLTSIDCVYFKNYGIPDIAEGDHSGGFPTT
jgi:hypothetical protein